MLTGHGAIRSALRPHTMTKANPIWSPEVTAPPSVTLIKLRPVSGLFNLNCTSSMFAFNWISLFGGIVRTLPAAVIRFGRTSSRSAKTAAADGTRGTSKIGAVDEARVEAINQWVHKYINPAPLFPFPSHFNRTHPLFPWPRGTFCRWAQSLWRSAVPCPPSVRAREH